MFGLLQLLFPCLTCTKFPWPAFKSEWEVSQCFYRARRLGFTNSVKLHTLSENKVQNCTFRGTMACHWGSTLRRYSLYPCGLYLTETNLVPLVAILYPSIEVQKWTFKKGTKLAFIVQYSIINYYSIYSFSTLHKRQINLNFIRMYSCYIPISI